MKCKKCGKQMEFLKNFEKVTETILPDPLYREAMLHKQVIICENCEQPYAYVKSMGKLRLKRITPRWLSKQTQETRDAIKKSVEDMKENLKTAKFIKSWYDRMVA